MGFLVVFILLIIFTWLIYRDFLKTGLSKKTLLAGWGIKVVYSLFFMSVMSYHFSENGQPIGDIGNFLHDGKILNQYAEKHPGEYLQLLVGINADNEAVLADDLKETHIWDYGITADHINDNRLIIRINSLIHFVSFGNYWVHVIIFSFLSFIGLILTYRSLAPFIHPKKIFYYALFALPTIAFWGGGITKETILILALGIFIFSLSQLMQKFTLSMVLLGLIGIGLLIVNKPHAGLVIVPMSLFLLISRKRGLGMKGFWLSGAAVFLTLLIFCFTPEKVNLVDRISQKQQDLINLAKGGIFFINDSSFCAFDYQYMDHFEYNSDHKLIRAKKRTPGEYKLFGEKVFHEFTLQPSEDKYAVYLVTPPSETYVDVEPIDHRFSQLLKNTPAALFNVFFRPLPTDGGSNFKYLSFIENLLFLAFLAIVIIQRRTLTGPEKSWFFFLAISALILVLIIGWTTPIIGALVRYKVASHLLLLLAVFILWTGPKKAMT